MRERLRAEISSPFTMKIHTLLAFDKFCHFSCVVLEKGFKISKVTMFKKITPCKSSSNVYIFTQCKSRNTHY